MWVYHSMPREALTNTEDMRYQLLDYCYGVVSRTHSDEDGPVLEAVPEDVLVPPFESLFEQRVFNRIWTAVTRLCLNTARWGTTSTWSLSERGRD